MSEGGGRQLAQGQQVVRSFRRLLEQRGYQEAERVPLVSHHDPSIRFTNSTISVLKKSLEAGVSEEGVFLVQPALRLQNVQAFRRTSAMSPFASYFHALGTLDVPRRSNEVALLARDFLVSGLGVSPERILVRASSEDPDLLSICRHMDLPIEVDGYEQRRYRHIFGMDGVSGRNFNVAIRSATGTNDVGNFILIERNGVPMAVELAFGVSTLVSRVHSYQHPIHASLAASAVPVNSHSDAALADALGSSIPLLMEGLESRSRGRSGNLKACIQIVRDTSNGKFTDEDLSDAVRAIAEAEVQQRLLASQPRLGLTELSVAEVVTRFDTALAPAICKSIGLV